MNRIRPTLLAVLAAITLDGALSGCGSTTTAPTTTSEGPPSTEAANPYDTVSEAEAEAAYRGKTPEEQTTPTQTTTSTQVGVLIIPR